jgi:hypothetical protein
MTGTMKIGGGKSGQDRDTASKQSVSVRWQRSGNVTPMAANTLSTILLMAAAI